MIHADTLRQRSTPRSAIICCVQVMLGLSGSLKCRALSHAVCNSETYQECVDGENASLEQHADTLTVLVHA